MRRLELKNKKFNRLFVLKYVGHQKWLCECECGNKIIAYGSQIKSGHTQSCGCLQKERTSNANTKHHYCKTPIYTVWQNMRERCNRKTNKEYHNYGGRGIKVCDEWNANFENFKDWAFNNGYEKGLTIDRIDVNKDYEPNNCRFVNWKEQANNTRRTNKIEFCGIIKSRKQWAETFDINYGTFTDRIKKRKWEFYKCLGFATREEAEQKLEEIGEKYDRCKKNT